MNSEKPGLKQIFYDSKSIAKETVGKTVIIAHTLLLLGLIFFNYAYDFEDAVLDLIADPWTQLAAFFAFQAIPYLISVGILVITGVVNQKTINPGFFLMWFFGFALLSFDRAFSIRELIGHTDLLRFTYRLLSNFKGAVFIILPIVAFSLWRERKFPEYLRINPKRFDWKPYALLLGCAFILVFIAGFFTDIQNFYPKFQRSGFAEFAALYQVPTWPAVLAYELAYAFDFISIEFFFRGFLVVAMSRYLGPQALFPMIVAYCILHFGKPLTETISSIFGGYILGILAIHHRNIWGGVMVHVGMAWMMEAVGFLHNL